MNHEVIVLKTLFILLNDNIIQHVRCNNNIIFMFDDLYLIILVTVTCYMKKAPLCFEFLVWVDNPFCMEFFCCSQKSNFYPKWYSRSQIRLRLKSKHHIKSLSIIIKLLLVVFITISVPAVAKSIIPIIWGFQGCVSSTCIAAVYLLLHTLWQYWSL